jgi:hypothetical protein
MEEVFNRGNCDDVDRIVDGKIAKHWAGRDDLGMRAQFGQLPQPAAGAARSV